MLIKRFLILIPALFLLSFCHKFYVSLVEINHNQADSTLEITMKVFTDDLEDALEDHNGIILRLGTQEESRIADSLIFEYINEKFVIGTDTSFFSLVYLGKEVELDVTWIYLEVEKVPSLSTFTVTDDMLIERFDNQVNIINVMVQGKKHGLLLRNGKRSDSLTF